MTTGSFALLLDQFGDQVLLLLETQGRSTSPRIWCPCPATMAPEQAVCLLLISLQDGGVSHGSTFFG
jgi:hypothetical protein